MRSGGPGVPQVLRGEEYELLVAVLLGELKELGRGEAAVNHVLRGKSEAKRFMGT
jgi:hypothetical protein